MNFSLITNCFYDKTFLEHLLTSATVRFSVTVRPKLITSCKVKQTHSDHASHLRQEKKNKWLSRKKYDNVNFISTFAFSHNRHIFPHISYSTSMTFLSIVSLIRASTMILSLLPRIEQSSLFYFSLGRSQRILLLLSAINSDTQRWWLVQSKPSSRQC